MADEAGSTVWPWALPEPVRDAVHIGADGLGRGAVHGASDALGRSPFEAAMRRPTSTSCPGAA